MITLKDIQNNKEVLALLKGSQKQLNELGYTEHSIRHVSIVSKRAGEILEKLGYNKERVELAKIAGYLHDIGNSVNRIDHAQSGALLTYSILKDIGLETEKCIEIMTAIGNHDEETGEPVSDISAALILADKSDVHRNRVVNPNATKFHIHDRVNYAVTESNLNLNKKSRIITLDIQIDTKICPVLDYFEIFLKRTMMSKYAAKYLKLWFELVINGTRLL